jgi:hypothetical protein
VLLQSLERIRALPDRHRIRSSRLRASGFFAQCKRRLFATCPVCFDVQDCCSYTSRKLIKPFIRSIGLYSILCECTPLLKLLRCIQQLCSALCTFRWLPDWCPPFVLRLRREFTSEEEDAQAEAEAQRSRVRQADDDPLEDTITSDP